MGFSDNLRELLDFHDIELKELSTGTNISKNTLDNYLSGQKSIPNAENAVRIAQFLDTTVEYLITGKNKTPKATEYDDTDAIIDDLHHLSKTDYESIKNIIKSLSAKYKLQNISKNAL